MKRRDFLKTAAVTATALSSCSKRSYIETRVPEVTAEQAAGRKTGRSTVALIPCPDYEADMFALLKEYAPKVGFPDMKGKKVVLKPNMVEFRKGSPITTNPAVLKAVIRLADHLGAKSVTVAEGPGHMRDTEFLLASTGLGQACKDMGVEFVDLNLDDIVKVDNPHSFTKLDEFYLPKTIMEADLVGSVPKLKTHHWVGVTCSMKNFFGAVPGRKYGWPKNLLHQKGIPFSIIDLNRLIKPAFAVVDAVTAMQGDGPINGTAIDTHFLAMGTDLAALDATCIRITQINPLELSYMILAGKVLGNVEEKEIDVIGSSVAKLTKPFEQPITIKNKELLAKAANQGS